MQCVARSWIANTQCRGSSASGPTQGGAAEQTEDSNNGPPGGGATTVESQINHVCSKVWLLPTHLPLGCHDACSLVLRCSSPAGRREVELVISSRHELGIPVCNNDMQCVARSWTASTQCRGSYASGPTPGGAAEQTKDSNKGRGEGPQLWSLRSITCAAKSGFSPRTCRWAAMMHAAWS